MNKYSVDVLLSRLKGVKPSGAGKWMACCPAHDDKSPSLAIRDTGDRFLLHCFAGCSALDVVHAVGLELADLFAEGYEAEPMAFAKAEMAKKRKNQEEIEKAKLWLAILTASLKNGEDIVTPADIEKGKKLKRWLATQGAL